VIADEWLRAARGTLVMATVAPELDGAEMAARQLERAGAIVAAGHTGANEATFRAAISRARTPLVTHLFNGMEALHHRAPGPVGAALHALAAGEVAVELIADGTHLDPATVRMVFEIDPGANVVLVSDAMVAAGMPDGPYRLGSLDVVVRDGTAWTTTASPALAGSTSHLADVLRHTINVAMIDPVTAVAAATATPARLLGLHDRGLLAEGMRADLTIFSDDWHVRASIRHGKRM
jgi:N-acetylglucosamine-6-phosphate deacetylase